MKISELSRLEFPQFTGLRILLMPIVLHDLPASLPSFARQYEHLLTGFPRPRGIGYLTIDERFVPRGKHHRRPGLHVDGWADDEQDSGTWGGGGSGGSWGNGGWITASTSVGCAAYPQEFTDKPKKWGDCEHLRPQVKAAIILKPLVAYAMPALLVHETVPATQEGYRQFIRLSMPSRGGWPSSCTANPLGVKPSGPVIAPRPAQFSLYQPS